GGILCRGGPPVRGAVELLLVHVVEGVTLRVLLRGVLLLGMARGTQPVATRETQREHADGQRPHTEPAPQPTHEAGPFVRGIGPARRPRSWGTATRTGSAPRRTVHPRRSPGGLGARQTPLRTVAMNASRSRGRSESLHRRKGT